MLQKTMFVPGSPGMGAPQDTGSALLDPETVEEVIFIRLSITIANVSLFALTPVEFCRVQLSAPVRPPTTSLGVGLAESEMETTDVPAGGFPCTVVRCTGPAENEALLASRPAAEDDSVMSPLTIWAATFTVMDAPGSRLPSEQFRVAIPWPPWPQLPWLGCAAIR